MNLSKAALAVIPSSAGLTIPAVNVFDLPEKVLQFGTGVLLRGLPDMMINKANNEGVFNGRIVVIKSTDRGDTMAFDKQDNLYTVCVRGISDGQNIHEDEVVTAISRVLSAVSEWDAILECAGNPDMQVIISNTTELGITLTKDNVHSRPPVSFPGKLLAFLYQRFKIFNGDPSKGMVIIPTELIPNNADKLLAIVLELAHQNGLEISFIEWLENANPFCSSLVDRIVPGKLNDKDYQATTARLGYEDELMIMAEPYTLWAIEAKDERVNELLSFASVNEGIVIAENIDKFREIKLRLLNGTHSFCCGLAILAGFTDVKEAMNDRSFLHYVRTLLKEEIIPAIVGDEISTSEAERFAASVCDRFLNKSIDHLWTNIAVQYSTKMNMRNTVVINQFSERFSFAPTHMALGMAAHILYMKPSADRVPAQDENSAIYADCWMSGDAGTVVKCILGNEQVWSTDLSSNELFTEEVISWLKILMNEGATFALGQLAAFKTTLVNEK